jgi:hypothetical protein
MHITRLNQTSLAKLALVGATLALALPLSGCPTDQRAVETEAAKAVQTALAEGQKYVATQLPAAKDTAVAAAATQAAQLRQTLEAEVATRLPTKVPTVKPDVQTARDRLKAMTVMRSPWSSLVDAPIESVPGQRSAARYADVIDQFDVNSAELAGRYKTGGSANEDTRCNIFAGDVMRAMDVPLPTKGNLGKGQGDPKSTYSDPMTAQAALLNDYLNQRLRWVTSAVDPGRLSDWVEVKATTQGELDRLVAHVQGGKPALVSDSGHIAVIRPEQSGVTNWQGLTIAQAGLSNLLSGALKGHFSGTPQFFVHE